MERRKSRAAFFVRTLPALVALAAACAHFPTPARARQTPAPSPAPAQTPQARTGRSYHSGAPPKRPAAPAPQAESPVTFKEIAAESGVHFRHHASPTTRKYLPETMGGGVALFDFDRDGRLDLFFTNGAALSDPMPRGARPDKRDPR